MIRALRRPSARLRLTITFGGLFLVAGALLLALTYFLVRQTLPPAGTVIGFATQSPGVFPFPQPSPLPSPLASPGDATAVRLVDQAQQQVLFNLLVESAVALALMSVISALLGWIVAGRVLQPVHQITARARRLSEDTLHERIGLTGPDDEIKELADTFDAMLGRFDAAFESQQRFVANASHELRTPLTTQRALVDVNLADPDASPAQLRATLEKIRAVTDESEHLISSLLILARSEQGLERSVPVDLKPVASEVLDQARPAATARGLHVDASLAKAPVLGDRGLLERMIRNLVDNAVRYNVRGGSVQVSTGVADGQAFIRVVNTGDQIPPDAVPTLFEPFRRLNRDRLGEDGAGLGLSIVRSVAQAHGGTPTAKAQTGGGLQVSVLVPAANQP